MMALNRNKQRISVGKALSRGHKTARSVREKSHTAERWE